MSAEHTQNAPLSREAFELYHYGSRLSYEDYVKTHCPSSTKRTKCPHRDNFRRLPASAGGLGLCENLKD